MNCPECNNIVPDGSMFCNHCGHKFEHENTIKCPNPECGHLIPADSKFCPDCGSKISDLTETKTNVAESNNHAPIKDPLDYLFPYIDKGRVGFKSLIDNNVYIPAKYDDARDFHEGFAAAKTNGKWGYMDKSGKWALKASYDDAEDVQNGIAITSSGSKYQSDDCCMNFWNTGNWKCFASGQYTSHAEFRDGVCNVWNDGKKQWNDDDSDYKKIIYAPWRSSYDGGHPFGEYVIVWNNSRKGVIKHVSTSVKDNTWIEIIPCSFEHIMISDSGTKNYFFVELNSKIGLYDSDGNVIFPIKYDNIGIPKEGLVAISDNHKLGFGDLNGRIIIPFDYEYEEWDGLAPLPVFKCGYVNVLKNGKPCILDLKGNIVVSSYDEVPRFYNGKAIVSKDGKYGMIDKNENILISLVYDSICTTSSDSFPEQMYSLHKVVLNGEKFIVDDYGNRVDYDEMKVSEITPLRVWVRKGGLWGLVDNTGRVIHECIFNPGFFTNLFFNEALPRAEYQGKRYLLDFFGGLKEE